MEKYYINGKEISKEEANEIKKKNLEYLESGDFELIAKCEFIVVIKENK